MNYDGPENYLGPNPDDEPEGVCDVCGGDTSNGECERCILCAYCNYNFNPEELPVQKPGYEPACEGCRKEHQYDEE